MKAKIKILISAVLALLVVIIILLVWQYRALQTEHIYLQKNIDTTLLASIGDIYADLFYYDNSNITTDRAMQYVGHTAIVESIYYSSSYADNQDFRAIVLILEKMSMPCQEYEIITDREFIQALRNYLAYDIDDTEKTSEMLAALTAQLQPIEAAE
ncbi:MAG: hypothetical protein LUG13_08670 [Oscillospiraceae bacterium]|nr:hypothetical protein [Oscillospiraceae bacterium]